MQPGFTCELNNTPVTARDLQTLMPGKWLNDEVINFYMQLIMGRSANAGGGKAASLPKVHAFNTFFFSTLRENGYARVKRWTRRIDVFAMDLVVVPVHLGVHWCCAIVDFGQRSIRYYDALLGENTECLELLMEYLRLESRDKRGGKVFDEQGWAMTCEKDIPRQQNGYDCGVFAVAFAEHIARGAELDFAQENCAFLRRKMVYEIATKALLH
ncbi:hypothetical protein BX661DRAFT_138513 [Kickxella alabastrina]|uniref:uncharacterized protein n=1 Tax=Kickxella alabastrina TaxID=61397 RepID=UPI0022207188|nr:uncharacterized protein BX661DRAFT_138513 [Kickxella alabastrina]KAI7834419.1 hypothetical protein BX661DRAFT_138513 [Kickxella alabastrina]